jgi:tetratricopeptide (TPR) repeat protein
MTRWRIIGVIATALIALSVPLYLLRVNLVDESDAGLSNDDAVFVGSSECEDCHRKEYDSWHDSHHDRAMEVASDSTVLGDFDDAEFEYFGIISRFYRRDGKFYVHTQGPGGEPGEFEVTHTFGWYPLQQYLVPFPGGRYQCLPIAWDSRDNKWFHLYPDEPIDPNDWLYWTNAGQNWNGMCAECHSTNLQKDYDIDSDTYQTTWSDIDVGCEACHGPGSQHVAWAAQPDMARPQVDNFNLLVRTSGLTSRDQVELCAPCHSRRAILGDYTHAEPDLLDVMLPTVLSEGLYYADGQILDEVYVYGSFTQSKMYHQDVRCSDCHDVHSIKTVQNGNELCLQCHRAAEYDTKSHHFHKSEGEDGEPIRASDGSILFDVGSGAECVQCHMPGRIYMGNDYRPDHSFRVPRPDLSVSLGVPNACNRCHVDKSAQWSDERMTEWYGPGRQAHYATIFDAARRGEPSIRDDLTRLAADPLYPVIVRATAIQLLGAYTVGEDTDRLFTIAMMDDEALIRRAALEHLSIYDPALEIRLVSPMLYDPVKGVRIEAAARLAGAQARQLSLDVQQVHARVQDEYVAAMEYSGDFTFGRFNLGNLYVAIDSTSKAVENYLAAIRIDDLTYAAKVNLSMLYNQLGNNDEAERLLREVLASYPDMYDVAYSLALLLVERERHLLLQMLGRDVEAEEKLQYARQLEPDNLDFLYALCDFYLKRDRIHEARQVAQDMVERHPDQRIGHDILEATNR